MNGGQIIAKVIKQYGIKHLFTLCGGHIAPIYVEAEKEGITVVDVRDEASAVFAADAYARLKGLPGVAAVTAGPGLTNSITALKNAQLAQSPILLLGGATATMLKGKGALQDIDQIALIKPHVKWVVTIKRLRDLAAAVQKAITIALEGIPGPVFIELPVDLLFGEAQVREWYGQETSRKASIKDKFISWYLNNHLNRMFSKVSAIDNIRPTLPSFPTIASFDLQKVIQQLKKSQQPVLIISSGAMQAPQKANDLQQAIKKLGIPVYLSGMARGLTGHKYENQYRHQRKKALREADCILLAGVPCDFRLGYGKSLNRKAFKITINKSAKELRKNISPHLKYQCDPADFLIRLANDANEFPSWNAWKDKLQSREDSRELEIQEMAGEKVKGINPLALFNKMDQLLPEASVLVVDGGDFAATASYTLRPRAPLKWLDPGVFGTLGVGGGFALGAALLYPDDYIWIVYGDGSAAYSLVEFDTFKKRGLKVCAIIGNNGSWEQIARDQVTMLGAATATTLPQSDYQEIAKAFGAKGERVESLEEFEQAMQNAKESMDKGVPYLINAIIGSTPFRKGSISI